MTAPYDAAARTYLGAGWWPIPVLGRNTPVKYTTGYDGTVSTEKVEAWLTDDMLVRAQAGRGVRVDNIAIRHQGTLAIDVDHGYGDKNGVEQLAAYAQRAGLPPLPATWSSTARGDDSPSRQYLYRVPEEGVRYKTKPCNSVELCVWHHRFTVCAPTIHEKVDRPYAWYLPGAEGVPPSWGSPVDRFPTPGELPMLPTEWFQAFRGNAANADRTAAVVDLPELFASFPSGDPDGLVAHLITKWSDETQHVGHDEFKNALINALMVGREGHPGVPVLYEVLVNRYTGYLAVARPDEAEHEVRSLVDACVAIAQQKPVEQQPMVVEVEPVDEDTWNAFITTFTDDVRPWMGDNRQKWLRDALLSRPRGRVRTFQLHALKGIDEVISGHYSAQRAVDLLVEAAPAEIEDVKTELRVCLSAALSKMEGATR